MAIEATRTLATKILLDKIDALATGQTLTREGVATQLGISLAPAQRQPNAYTQIYEGGRDFLQRFDGVELRVPAAESDPSRQLLILTINTASQCISMAAAIERYGNGELVLPSPQQPPESPVYMAFPKPWGRVSFGFARDATKCLCTVVIDVGAPARRPEAK